ncbi:hypothetical protein [Avibacterium paragallinarum]|uniref:Uncharacterized protein n=2 Tax=Avibacterium paragallinarum TaxID=728 RepID=A0A377IBC2_AVIPA|nr:hypothetical protein [Avibacterium paragallinarum]RZN75738.1 hypothetical protein EC523_07160 [Avibacterium paragallinarum]RZN76550.1 hypothetical protein EC523_04570 [Avibacterium paragallinarum]CDF99711.1 Putative uncharacterized protein [Avibacterium paragallinarum JF4211]STO71894.1 Uncharacterised protein [Avibacterium paragallinarum]STO72614.1 Uncharacterised protein [Avibacterium paragallinarum]
MIDEKVRMTIEIEMERHQLEQLEISSKTDVLGGNIVRLDWEGGVFDEVDAYRTLFDTIDPNLMMLLFDNLDNEDFVNELQLAIKRAITPVIKDKRKAILESEK